ncbi:MAG: GGDEF domain-containing protein [Lysobacterales bacterium]
MATPLPAPAPPAVLYLDIRTVLLLSMVITLVLGLSLVAAWRSGDDALARAQRLWVRGCAVQPLAWVLLGLRGAIPDVFSVLLANLLIVASFADFGAALVRLRGARPPWRAVGLLLTAVAVTQAAFIWLRPSLQARVVLISAALLLLSVAAVRAVWRLQAAPRPRSHWLVALAFGLGALVLAVRIVVEGLLSPGLATLLQGSPMQSLVFVYGAVVPIASTIGFLLIGNDRHIAELQRLVALDPLTGALNRRTLERQADALLQQAQRRGQAYSLLLLDADHFKQVNDAFGHDAGDEVLRAVVAVLRQGLRPADLVGRLGGEEFVVVLPDAGTAAALQRAEQLRAAVAALRFEVAGRRVPLTVSIGLATAGAESFADLLRRADHAMYAAKHAGRNRVELAPEPVAPPPE